VVDVGHLKLAEITGTDRECTQNFGQKTSWRNVIFKTKKEIGA
jgi:hypothetical protein